MSYNPLPQTSISSRQLVTNYTNASALSAIPQGQACSTNSLGLLVPLDVSSQASWSAFVGYANARIPVSASGPIITNGRLENFVTAYPVGTALYIDTSGNPTNIQPAVGVNGFTSGDMVIFLGVIVPNETVMGETDISLFTQFIGVL